METKTYWDKIYKRLLDDNVRDKVLNGKLDTEECTNSKVYDFLKLLHWYNGIQYSTQEYEKIEIEE